MQEERRGWDPEGWGAGVEGEVGRRARRLELAVETGAKPESARQRVLHLILWTLNVLESGAKGLELCLRFRLMTVWFAKVNVTPPPKKNIKVPVE